MAFIKILDPLNNEVYFDQKSIGLAILNSELSSFTHDIIRKTLSGPTAILQVDKDTRVYILFTLSSHIRIVNVKFTGDFWYARDVDIEKSRDELLLLIQAHKAIYKK
jgi:hypothetical protein